MLAQGANRWIMGKLGVEAGLTRTVLNEYALVLDTCLHPRLFLCVFRRVHCRLVQFNADEY